MYLLNVKQPCKKMHIVISKSPKWRLKIAYFVQLFVFGLVSCSHVSQSCLRFTSSLCPFPTYFPLHLHFILLISPCVFMAVFSSHTLSSCLVCPVSPALLLFDYLVNTLLPAFWLFVCWTTVFFFFFLVIIKTYFLLLSLPLCLRLVPHLFVNHNIMNIMNINNKKKQ